MTKYQYYKDKILGEGTYAVIYLGYQIENSSDAKKIIKEKPSDNYTVVAIKRIKKSEHSVGHEISSYREIKSYKALKSPYILNLLDIFIYKSNLHLILEYTEYDLEKIIKNQDIVILPGDIKSWMYMLLCAIKECHDSFIIHRDIKPNNLLIKKNGTLKLADFGISRPIADKMTPDAIARWYRPPELLLGQRNYSFKAEMWSIGAVFAELFLRVPLFPGDSDIKQLDLICKLLGTPDDPKFTDLNKSGIILPKYPPTDLRSIFIASTEDSLELLKGLLEFDPNKRFSVEEALNHRYFRTKPFATNINEFRSLQIMNNKNNKN